MRLINFQIEVHHSLAFLLIFSFLANPYGTPNVLYLYTFENVIEIVVFFYLYNYVNTCYLLVHCCFASNPICICQCVAETIK